MDMIEKGISSEIKFKGRIISLIEEQVLLPNGDTASREVIIHPGGVCVVAVDDEENVYMVKQYRRPYDEIVLEIPAGKLNPGEEPSECGKRELEEETGLTAEKFLYLGKLYPSPGYCGETIHIYLATGLKNGVQNPDDDEFLEVYKYKLSELVNMCVSGEIYDAKTIAGIMKTNELLKKRKV